jgi:hypothetical protein
VGLNNDIGKFMKIAYIITPSAIVSGNSNGIKSQALSYQKILENNNHNVININNWEHYNFREFDAIHFFGNGTWMLPIVKRLSDINNNIFISPIIDSNTPNFIYYLYSLIGFSKLKLATPSYSLTEISKYIKGFVVRSNYEFDKVKLLTSKHKIFKIGLAIPERVNIDFLNKKQFCLHVSSIHQKRKNVIRLIRASKKYNFKLILAGSTGSKEQFKSLQDEISDSPNIIVKGFVTAVELDKLYTEAKVFALPSLREGVGIVALDAAMKGCNIVITERGGGKEFYNDYAYTVNPKSVNEIGNAVMKSMAKDFDIRLLDYLCDNYSNNKILDKLENTYNN